MTTPATLRPPAGLRRTLFAEEHDAFREAVRAFFVKEALPHTERWEREGVVDRDYWRKAAAQGMVGFAAPERFGGADLDDFRFNAVITEELVRTGAVGDLLSLTNDIVAPYLLHYATDEQQQRWLPGMTAGEHVWAIAMSEPGTGSDLRAVGTTAHRVDGGWTLSGSKTFVTAGIQADLVIVFARIADRDGGGYGLFVVAAEQDWLRARAQAGEDRPPRAGHRRALLRAGASCPRPTCSASRVRACAA